jgi:hypothetical protein
MDTMHQNDAIKNGTPFRPSNASQVNASQVYAFEESYCHRCYRFRHLIGRSPQCSILMSVSFCYEEEPEYPRQWQYQDGQPVCTSFKTWATVRATSRLRFSTRQMRLFTE